MVRAVGPTEFIEEGKWLGHGWVHGATITWFRSLESEKLWWVTFAAGIHVEVFPPCPGLFAERMPPLVAEDLTVEMIFPLYRDSYKQYFFRWRFPKILADKQNRHMATRFDI